MQRFKDCRKAAEEKKNEPEESKTGDRKSSEEEEDESEEEDSDEESEDSDNVKEEEKVNRQIRDFQEYEAMLDQVIIAKSNNTINRNSYKNE